MMQSFHDCGETLVQGQGQSHKASSQPAMDMEQEEFCWICLDDSTKQGVKQQLVAPCRCPRKVHPCCLARWQLQQAGRAEETHCRFCASPLADWKASLTPEMLRPDVERVKPIMVVYFEGEIHRIPVKQGNEGLNEFTNRIRELFRLPEDVDISLTFGCKEPMSGQHLKLEGIGAFDAAVHCASVAAADRQHKIRSSGGGGGDSVGPGGSSPTHSTGGSSSSSQATPVAARASSASPTPCFSSSPTVSRGGGSPLGTSNLRHSTGSSFPPLPPSAPEQPGAARRLPDPFQDGQPTWMTNTLTSASSPPTLLERDEQLLLHQHLQHLSHSLYSHPPHNYPQSPLDPVDSFATQQLLHSHNSTELLAPGTPNARLRDAHARHASPLPSMLPLSLADHVPSRTRFLAPSTATSSTLSSADSLGLPQASATSPLPYPEPAEQASPSSSIEGLCSRGPAQMPSMSRRACRSPSLIGDAPPAPCDLQQQAARDGNPAGEEEERQARLEAGGEARDVCSGYGGPPPGEAMAWAAGLTGSLRGSIKAFSRACNAIRTSRRAASSSLDH